jgi:peptidoglycan hydrolase-like protein with peptidoglycan-binding domain
MMNKNINFILQKNLLLRLFLFLCIFFGFAYNTSLVFAETPFDQADLWLKADAITGLSDGDPVNSWVDSSSNGIDATQTTSDYQPIYKTGIINTLPTVNFDGSDDLLVTPSQNAAAGITVFTVVKSADTSSSNFATFGDINNAIITGDSNSLWEYFDTPRTTLGNISTSEFQIITSRVGSSINGAWSLGSDPALILSSPWGGFVAEYIVFKSVLSDDDYNAVYDYLYSKYFVQTVPGVSTGLTTSPASEGIFLSWTAPSNGGASISDYLVEYKLSSDSTWSTFDDGTSTSTTALVTGLTNNLSYNFRVSATNSVGTGLVSNIVTTTVRSRTEEVLLEDDFTGTTIDTNKWVEIDTAGSGGTSGNVQQNGSLTVANSTSGGNEGVNALVSVDSFDASGLEISAVMTGGDEGILGYGDNNWRQAGSEAYFIYINGLHFEAYVFYDGVEVALDLSCGTVTDGATYSMKIINTGFEVYKNDVLQCTVEPDIDNFVDNKPIFLQVRASDATAFDDVSVKGFYTFPEQVTGLEASGYNQQAQLSWIAPSNGGASISDYLVEYKLSSDSTWSTFNDGTSTSTTALVTGLTNNLSYNFRVSALNNAGTGNLSTTVTTSPRILRKLVFVFNGESNSGGLAKNNEATEDELAPSNVVQHLNNTTFLFEDLDIGTNNNIDHCCSLDSATQHGLELQLNNRVEENIFSDNPQIHLIKTGQGGSRVSDWNVDGTYWAKFLERVNAAKTQLSTDRQWVTWISIGLNDFAAGTNVSTFKIGLIDHINKIKDELPDTIIILTQFQAMSANSGYPNYNAAMDEIAASEHNVFVVDSTGADLEDGSHWSYDGFKVLADRMINITNTQLGLIYPSVPTGLSATPGSDEVELFWTAPIANGGESISDYLIEYKLSSDTTWSTFNNGTSIATTATVTGLLDSEDYNLRVSGINANGAGSPVITNATTLDSLAPILSSILSNPSSTTVDITWTTNEAGSSIIEYGLTNSYGTSTTEINTSPRITSHSVSLSSLVACTTYHYRVRSKDEELNEGISIDKTFTTTECAGGSSVRDESSTSIIGSIGGISILNEISLDIPSGATGDAVYQIKALDKNIVLGSVGSPTNLTAVSNFFDLKALTGVGTTITSFSNDIQITLSYLNDDVSGIDESLLVIYRYDGSNWYPLSSCVVDTAANTVTCSTSNFSVFGLFGAPTTVSTPSGGRVRFGCKDEKALNYDKFSKHKQFLCTYENDLRNVQKKSPYVFTQDLKQNDMNEDVRSLQKLLNSLGFTVSGTGPGSVGNETNMFGPATKSALMRYQQSKGIKPAVGYFGPITRLTILIKENKTNTEYITTSKVNHDYIFNHDLELGSVGEDVKKLQIYLNSNNYSVSNIGAGSAGSETIYFGKLTKQAMIRYQKDNNIKPPQGYFGPITRKFINTQ